MYTGRTVFAQVMDVIPRRAFERCVQRYPGARRFRSFSCYDHLLCLVFAQLTYRESLRDIETCLRALQPKLYHVGLRGRIARSTLADANETRDWRIFADFAQILIRHARSLYLDEPFAVALAQTAYAFDATTIDLCLALFPWARFRRTKAAVKLHTLLDLRGPIPTFVAITDGKAADVTQLDGLVFEPGAFYIFDRGYTDFARLYAITEALAFFVIRGKRGLAYVRRVSRPVDKTTGLRSDQTIVLCGPKTATLYPRPVAAHHLRRSRDAQAVRVPDQQLHAARPADRPTLQVPMASRTVLQMDQAAPADQSFLRHVDERGENPGVERHQRVRAGGDPQESTPARTQPLRTPPNSEPHAVRAGAAFSGSYGVSRARSAGGPV